MADKSDFGQSTVNEYLSDEMKKRGCTRRREGLREKPRTGVVISAPRIERSPRLLLLSLFLSFQDLPLQRMVSLIEGFLALRSVWGLVLR